MAYEVMRKPYKGRIHALPSPFKLSVYSGVIVCRKANPKLTAVLEDN